MTYATVIINIIIKIYKKLCPSARYGCAGMANNTTCESSISKYDVCGSNFVVLESISDIIL